MTLGRAVPMSMRADTRWHNAGEGLAGRKLRQKEECSLHMSRLEESKTEMEPRKMLYNNLGI